MAQNWILALGLEDLIPTKNQYSWSYEHELTLDDFLKKYKPSMVENDGLKPWIWANKFDKPDRSGEQSETAMEKAKAVLAQTAERVESIKTDDSILTRSNKKTGAKSKKEVREAAQSAATESLHQIAKQYKYTNGKWLIFASHESVNTIWSMIARSLVSGPLSKTAAYCAKVATTPMNPPPGYQHVICVYVPDVFDKQEMLRIMKVLLREHGCSLSGVKADLYTVIGLDSKHPSGIPSTIWKNSALMPDAEMKALKEAHYKESKGGKTAGGSGATGADATGTKSEAAAKSPIAKKRKKNDPFASDGDEDDEAATSKKAKK